MPQGRRIGSRALIVGLAALLCWLPTPAAAQSPGDGGRSRVPPPPPSDFMLGRPRVFIAFDSGFLFANTGSDLYDFISDTLTIDRKSFNTPALGGRIGVALTPRVEVMVGLEHMKSQTGSEYRDFVDNLLLPITQTTTRQEYSLTGSVRFALLPSGRRISRFAWIPRTVTPYVGAGGGAIKYEFQQYGSFVDFETSRVFTDTFVSAGWTPSVHALAGADVRVFRKLYLTVEGRHTWSTATLSTDFVDFDPIDLAGFRLGGGLRVAF
jgi:hypothetical protein